MMGSGDGPLDAGQLCQWVKGERVMTVTRRQAETLPATIRPLGWPDLPASIIAKPARQETYPVDVFPRVGRGAWGGATVCSVVSRHRRRGPAGGAGPPGSARLEGADTGAASVTWRPLPGAHSRIGSPQKYHFSLMAAGHQEADVRLQARWKAAVQQGSFRHISEGEEYAAPRRVSDNWQL